MSEFKVRYLVRHRLGEYSHEEAECELHGEAPEVPGQLMKQARVACESQTRRGRAEAKKKAALPPLAPEPDAGVISVPPEPESKVLEEKQAFEALIQSRIDRASETFADPSAATALVETEAIEATKKKIEANVKKRTGGMIK